MAVACQQAGMDGRFPRKSKGYQRCVQWVIHLTVITKQVDTAAAEQSDDTVDARKSRKRPATCDVRNAHPPVKTVHVGTGRLTDDFTRHTATVLPGCCRQIRHIESVQRHVQSRWVEWVGQAASAYLIMGSLSPCFLAVATASS